MNWTVAIAVVLVAAAAFGLFLGARKLMTPAGLAGVISFAVSALLPDILKRKSPEEEAKDHQDVRQRTERTITGRERGR